MLTDDEITLRVFRFDPSCDEGPRYQVYRVPYQEHMRVLDALNYVYDELGDGLAYRWYCGVKKCGECALTVNGQAMMSCWEPVVGDMTCDPLTNFPIVRDLVVDVSGYERGIVNLSPFVQRSDHPRFPERISHDDMELAHNLSSCIECNVCTAEVPIHSLSPEGVSWDGYAGPAALVKLARFVLDPRDETDRTELALRAGLREFPLYTNLQNLCPQGIDIVQDALAPSQRKLFESEGALAEPVGSTRVFLRGKQWNGFVKLADEHKSALVESGTIEPETITGIEEAYRLPWS